MDRMERFGLYVLFALLLFMVAVVAYGSVDCDDISVGCGDYYSKPFDSEGQARRFARLVILSCGKVSSVSVVSGESAIKQYERSGECPVSSFDASRWYLEMNISQASTLESPPPSNPEPTPRTPTQSTPPSQSSGRASTSSSSSIQQSLSQAQDTIPDEVVIPEPVEPEPVDTPVPCTETRVERIFSRGYTLYTPSVLSDGAETLSGLWERNWFTGSTGGAFYVVVDSRWLVYRGDGDVGDIPLHPNMGVLVYQETNGTTAGLKGCPVASPMLIGLSAGLHLIGFPVVPDTITRPSDLLSSAVHAVIVTQGGQFKLVVRAGDKGDDPLVDGQAVMIISTEQLTLELSPSVSAAPAAQRRGALVKSWGAMKRRD